MLSETKLRTWTVTHLVYLKDLETKKQIYTPILRTGAVSPTKPVTFMRHPMTLITSYVQ